MLQSQLPYGVGDLDPDVVVHPDDRDLVRCYVRGCKHFVRRPTRRQPGELCPDHGIYCHYSRYGSTYSYADVRRNIIASPDLFAERIVGHPFKYESHRLGSENSEDALSWNVFRSLQEAGCLAQVAKLLIGEDHTEEPRLYMWGIRVDDDSFEPWELLIAARERFESNLPMERPLTEPDIALHLPGKYLVLIEAKFTSPNPVYRRGPRKDAQSLTLDELLEIYWDPSLRILDQAKARKRDEIHYQLWRNMVFAEWMARLDNVNAKAYHVNLVRSRRESVSAKAFSQLISDQLRVRFCRCVWEDLASASFVTSSSDGSRLAPYFNPKTAGLRKAFQSFDGTTPIPLHPQEPKERKQTMPKSPEELDQYFDNELVRGPRGASRHNDCDEFVKTRDFITERLTLKGTTGNGSTSWPQSAKWKLTYYSNHPMLFGLRQEVARKCPQLFGKTTTMFHVQGVPFVGFEVSNDKQSFERIVQFIEAVQGHSPDPSPPNGWIRRLLERATDIAEFAIFSQDGDQITGDTEEAWLENWFRLAPPASGKAQWKDNRSAKELARAWFPRNCQPNNLPGEIDAVLSPQGIRPLFGVAEFRAELDGVKHRALCRSTWSIWFIEQGA